MQHRLLDHQDGVVHDNACEDDEAKHCQHVQRLADIEVQDGQTGDAAGPGHGNRQQDDQRQDEIA